MFYTSDPDSNLALITVEALSSLSEKDFLTAAHRDMVQYLHYFSQVTWCWGCTGMLQEFFVLRMSTQTYQKRDKHLTFPAAPLPVNLYFHLVYLSFLFGNTLHSCSYSPPKVWYNM